jgi:hypothetical protein
MSETQTPAEQSLGAFPTSDADPFEVAEEYAELFDDIDAEQYEAIKASISENGVETPIIIDADNKIIDGHHRVRAVRELRAAGESVPDIPFVQNRCVATRSVHAVPIWHAATATSRPA